MGFCFSATWRSWRCTPWPPDERVAVFDFDVHHGNGTESHSVEQTRRDVFLDSPAPVLSRTGTRNVGDNCFNYPVAPHTPREEYRKCCRARWMI